MSRQRNRESDTLSIELAKDFHDWAEFQAERDWFSGDASVAVYPISEMPDGVVNDLMKFVDPKDIFLHARYGAGIRETAVRHRINQALALHQSVMAAQSELNELLNDAKAAFAAAAAAAAEQATKSADEIEGLEAAITNQAATDAPAHRHDIPNGPLRWSLVTIPGLFSLRERFLDKKLDSKLIDQLLDRPVRQLPKATRHQLKALESLWADFPNFGPALTVIARSLRLQMHTGAAVRLPSMLLVGPPGIGKTEFSKRLAAAMSFEVTFRSLAETSAGFILTGHSSQWAKSAVGLIAQSVIRCPEGKAPLLVLDELDKARSQSDWAVDQALLGLLEPSSAKTFRDENLDIELDTRPVSYLLTANRIDTIRPELLSRLRIVQIQPPSQDQMPAVIRSLDRAIRSDTPALRRLFHPLGTDVIDCLAAQAPRLIRRILEDAYADALQSPKVGRRRSVRTNHLGISSKRTDASKARRPPIPPIFVHLEGWQWLQ